MQEAEEGEAEMRVVKGVAEDMVSWEMAVVLQIFGGK